jgi:hypothetical protein
MIMDVRIWCLLRAEKGLRSSARGFLHISPSRTGEAEQIVAALRARHIPVAYLRYEDEGHDLSKLANRLDAYAQMADFLDQHL